MTRERALGDVQRYTLTWDPVAQNSYMELDPGGRYVLFDEVLAASPADKAGVGTHQPGDEHRYTGLACVVCGQKGQVMVSIVPIAAPLD